MKRITLLCIIFLFIHCINNPLDFLADHSTGSKYPTRLDKLSAEERFDATNQFNAMTDNITANLDDYGLIENAGTLTRGQSGIQDAETAISLSKAKLIELCRFSNVYDSTLLEIQEATNSHGVSWLSDWVVSFKNQKYKNLEVLNTGILVLLGEDVKQISGHHYKDIYIPKEEIISRRLAIKILTGYVIEYQCWGPMSFEIPENSLELNEIRKVVFPIVKEDYIEFRIAWGVPVYYLTDNQSSWVIYIDVITGEILEVIPKFIC